MKTKFNSITMSFIIIVFLFNGCKKENSTQVNNDEISIAENVLIINELQSGKIVEINDNELTFSIGNSAIEDILVGDIIVSSIIDNLAPNGFLRRVLSITRSGEQIILTTENAELTDAINYCKFSYEKVFQESDIVGKKISSSFKIPLGEKTSIEGNIDVEPTLLFDLQIENAIITYAKFGMATNYEFGILLEYIGSETVFNKDLFEIDLRPIVILIAGIFPLVITPDFEVEAEFSMAGLSVSTNYEISGNTLHYVEKNNNTWSYNSNISDATGTWTGLPHGQDAAIVGFYTSIRPQLELQFYDIDSFETEFYVKKEVIANIDLVSCAIACASSLGVELDIEALDFKENPEFEVEVLDPVIFGNCK